MGEWVRGGVLPTKAVKPLPTVLLHHLSHEATHSALLSCACTTCDCHRKAQPREWTPAAGGWEEDPPLRISPYTKLLDLHLTPDCDLWLCVYFYPFLVITPGPGKPHTAVFWHPQWVVSVISYRSSSVLYKGTECGHTILLYPSACMLPV